jgi:hypothetical protein
VLLLGWFSIVLTALFLNKNSKTVFWIGVLYPLVELFVKIISVNHVLGDDNTILNRGEHFFFAAFLTYLLYKIIIRLSNKSNMLFNAILILGLLNLFGVLNEFFEFGLRTLWHLDDPAYYSDTILDLLTNILGCIFALVVLSVKHLPREAITKRHDTVVYNEIGQ